MPLKRASSSCISATNKRRYRRYQRYQRYRASPAARPDTRLRLTAANWTAVLRIRGVRQPASTCDDYRLTAGYEGTLRMETEIWNRNNSPLALARNLNGNFNTSAGGSVPGWNTSIGDRTFGIQVPTWVAEPKVFLWGQYLGTRLPYKLLALCHSFLFPRLHVPAAKGTAH